MPDLSVHVSRGCLVVPIQGDIDEEIMHNIQKLVLSGVEETGVKGVVIDLSGVKIIDPYNAGIIDKTAKMINLLGAKTVLSGIKPGVAIALSDSHFEFEEIFEIARTFEDGVEKLQSVVEAHEILQSEKEETEEEDEVAFEKERIVDEEVIEVDEVSTKEQIEESEYNKTESPPEEEKRDFD